MKIDVKGVETRQVDVSIHTQQAVVGLWRAYARSVGHVVSAHLLPDNCWSDNQALASEDAKTIWRALMILETTLSAKEDCFPGASVQPSLTRKITHPL